MNKFIEATAFLKYLFDQGQVGAPHSYPQGAYFWAMGHFCYSP